MFLHALILASTVFSILFILSALYSSIIWARRHQYTRERFALALLLASIFFTLFFLTTGFANLMPWYLPQALPAVLSGAVVDYPTPQWSEVLVFLFIYLLIIGFVFARYRSWGGLKSIDEYNRELQGESVSLFTQGTGELYRIVQRKPGLKPYSSAVSKQYPAQLEKVIDNLAWKDQARDLIRFSSSSYDFDRDTGWHDKEGCWVGRNVNTSDMVFLYPAQATFTTAEQSAFFSYAHRLVTEQSKEQYELIVAVKGGTDMPPHTPANKRVRYETEASLLDNLVDFRDYQQEIRRRVQVNKLPDSTLCIKDVYVRSKYFEQSSQRSSQSVEEHLLQWIEEPSQRQIALLGEYGQGKSTATLMFTYHLFGESGQKPKRIPILIELRGTSPRNQTPLQLLGAWASQYNINPQALLRLHIAGRLLLIFEGFDEMALVGDAEMRLKHFKMIWQFCYPQAKILITGRPNFFLDEEEMKAALGISKPSSDRPYCEAIRIAPFDVEQLSEALRSHKLSVREQIRALAQKNDRFLELVSRPSLLHIVSVLWEREHLSEQVDKLSSAYVMELFVRHSYRRQGLKESDVPDFMALTSAEREFFMVGIAAYMAKHRLPNQINKNQLNELIDKLLEIIPDSISTSTPAITGETREPLRLRLKDAEHGLEHVKTDVRACGLLVDDPAAPGTFRFGHKSFLEYLFAALLADYIQSKDVQRTSAVMRATQANIDDILPLPVSLGFLSELLNTTGKDNSSQKANKTGEQEIAQRIIALRLLRKILGGKAPIFAFKRFLVLDDASRTIAIHKGTFKQMAYSFLSPTTFLMFVAILFGGLSLFQLERGDPSLKEGLFVERATVFMLAALFMLAPFITLLTSIASLVVASVSRRPKFRSKMALWCYICKALGITDKVMHRVLWTWMLPGKDKLFDEYSTVLWQEGGKPR